MKLSSIDSISAPQNQAFCTRDVSFLNSFENVSFLNSFENVLTNKIVWKLMLFWKKIPLSHLSLFHHQYSLSLSLSGHLKDLPTHSHFTPFFFLSFYFLFGWIWDCILFSWEDLDVYAWLVPTPVLFLYLGTQTTSKKSHPFFHFLFF